ncbi:MAG TPA: N-acetylglucosamine-6-phosphate deacetylase, partial [Pseudolabrys sp.]
MEFAVAADHVFDGTMLRHDCAVVIEASRIRALTSRNALPAAIPSHHLPRGAWLAPGFIDTQVNGGGDVLFNDDPSPRGIAAIAAAHRRFGTTAMLPTLLSDTPQK